MKHTAFFDKCPFQCLSAKHEIFYEMIYTYEYVSQKVTVFEQYSCTHAYFILNSFLYRSISKTYEVFLFYYVYERISILECNIKSKDHFLRMSGVFFLSDVS